VCGARRAKKQKIAAERRRKQHVKVEKQKAKKAKKRRMQVAHLQQHIQNKTVWTKMIRREREEQKRKRKRKRKPGEADEADEAADTQKRPKFPRMKKQTLQVLETVWNMLRGHSTLSIDDAWVKRKKKATSVQWGIMFDEIAKRHVLTKKHCLYLWSAYKNKFTDHKNGHDVQSIENIKRTVRRKLKIGFELVRCERRDPITVLKSMCQLLRLVTQHLGIVSENVFCVKTLKCELEETAKRLRRLMSTFVDSKEGSVEWSKEWSVDAVLS